MRKKIMVVDDDTLLREMLVDILESEGHETAAAENGNAGIELYETFSPEIIVTDIRMPGKNGFEMVQYIRENSPEIPVVFISGWFKADVDYSEAGINPLMYNLDAPWTYFLQKPFRVHQLIEIIGLIEIPCT